MSVRIDRCLCHERPFTELRSVAERAACRSLQELQAVIPFGDSCGLCRPYVEKMLRTGQTVFTEIIEPPPLPKPGEGDGG